MAAPAALLDPRCAEPQQRLQSTYASEWSPSSRSPTTSLELPEPDRTPGAVRATSSASAGTRIATRSLLCGRRGRRTWPAAAPDASAVASPHSMWTSRRHLLVAADGAGRRGRTSAPGLRPARTGRAELGGAAARGGADFIEEEGFSAVHTDSAADRAVALAAARLTTSGVGPPWTRRGSRRARPASRRALRRRYAACSTDAPTSLRAHARGGARARRRRRRPSRVHVCGGPGRRASG